MIRRYHSGTPSIAYWPLYAQAAFISGVFAVVTVFFLIYLASLSLGGEGSLAGMYKALAHAACDMGILTGCCAILAGVAAYILRPSNDDKETLAICSMVRQSLFAHARGNPLHLKEGELLPRVWCESAGEGLYNIFVSTQEGVTADTIATAAPSISAALARHYQQYAVISTDIDVAFNYVAFKISNVKIDRSLRYSSSVQMTPRYCTRLAVDQITQIDLRASGSILCAGKTRSGKTTGVIALLLQVLLAGRDDYGSEVIIIDPKQAELSRLPHTVTLDEDGEARSILEALRHYAESITHRQKILNELSEERGDAVKWWNAGFHPSFIFIDEYVACRTILPKKAPGGGDYCLDTFDGLIKRIVTMGASAGCFAIISIAEASVQDGGLPAMIRSAMSTRILFRPTLPEGRLIWDADKLTGFPAGRVYGPGDAWFSSTDGVHDSVSYVHFPVLDFPAYRELGQLLQEYYR